MGSPACGTSRVWHSASRRMLLFRLSTPCHGVALRRQARPADLSRSGVNSPSSQLGWPSSQIKISPAIPVGLPRGLTSIPSVPFRRLPSPALDSKISQSNLPFSRPSLALNRANSRLKSPKNFAFFPRPLLRNHCEIRQKPPKIGRRIVAKNSQF